MSAGDFVDGCVQFVGFDRSAQAVDVTGTCHDRLDSSQRGDGFQTSVEWLALGPSHHGSQ